MPTLRAPRLAALSLACAFLLSFQAAAHAAEAARPAVGAVLTEAQNLLSAGQWREAEAKLSAAEAMAPLNEYEAFMTLRMRAAAAAASGDLARAQSALDALLATNRLEPADRLQMLSSMGQTLYRAKDYLASARWLQRYADAGGGDAEVLALRAPARYLANDHAGARELLLAATQADAAAGRVTPLTTWRMLAGSQAKLGDDAGYRLSLRRMAVQHPQPAFWAELVKRELGDATLNERQLLDTQRLLFAAGALTDANAALAVADEARRAGYPGEAVRILDAALAGPKLTADQSKALAGGRDSAHRAAEAERRERARDEKAALAARDGRALFNLGWTRVLEGEADAGLPLMAQGLQRGGLPRADEAQLHHGIALALAGRGTEARAALQLVRGEPAMVTLAGLWADFAERRVP
ncbi:MAG: hypothetical protein ACOZJX_15830 [Pseudomonadota bacterium]